MNRSYFVYEGIQYHIGNNGKYYKRHICWNNRPGWENFFLEIPYVKYMRIYFKARKAHRRISAE